MVSQLRSMIWSIGHRYQGVFKLHNYVLLVTLKPSGMPQVTQATVPSLPHLHHQITPFTLAYASEPHTISPHYMHLSPPW